MSIPSSNLQKRKDGDSAERSNKKAKKDPEPEEDGGALAGLLGSYSDDED
jgi:hypothetical protein